MNTLKSLVITVVWMPLAASAQVKYYPSIHSIIQKHCVSCHAPGQNAPFVFKEYDDVAKRISTILKVTENNSMPPWPADTTYVRYHEQNVLTLHEKKLLQQWAVSGMQKGKKVKSAAVVKPKLVANMQLPLTKRDTLGNTPKDVYVYSILDWYFKKPVYVSDYEFQIKTPYLHHSEILSVKTDSVITRSYANTYRTDAYEYENISIDKYLLGWFPGSSIGIFPKGTKMKLDSGEKFLSVLHYIPTAQKFIDSSKLMIQTTQSDGREVNEFAVHGTYHFLYESNHGVLIPANTTRSFHYTDTVKYDMSAFAVYGHAHHLCTNMLAYAVTSTMDTIPLLRIHKWNFNWQLSYRFDRYLKIPKNSVVHFLASYDNTDSNPENLHHPPKDVHASFMADDEMMEFFILNLRYERGDEKKKIVY